MRFLLPLVLILLPGDDDKVDPAKYRFPSEARSIEWRDDPPPRPSRRVYLGVSGATAEDEEGALLTRVLEGSPAAKAGLRSGDRVLRFGGTRVETYRRLLGMLAARRPGEVVPFLVEREGEEIEIPVTLGERRRGSSGPEVWKERQFRLAAVLFEFPDCRHNPDFEAEDFRRLLFSVGEYRGRDPSGMEVYGSLADYYREVSHGRLSVTGKVFDWVEIDEPRSYFEDRRMGDRAASGKLLPRAIELVRGRDGEDCFDGFDGIVFIHAGRQTYQRPRMLWPHRSSIRAGRKSVAYYLNAEGGRHFNGVGVHVHEFGHMLGLPDQYGRNHATGVGKWCTMAVGHMGGGASRNRRPYHLCVWCRERLGWTKPTAIDPGEKQWLKLAPIEKDPSMAFKLRAGGETYYFECRDRIGFDTDIEQTGLLVWRRKPGGELDLVEAHGKDVSNASLVETAEIPFPSFYNRHFTPDTRPAAPAGLHVTDIVKQDGMVFFKIGHARKVASRKVEKRRQY